MTEEMSYSVFLDHRPRRIAFLVDPEKVSDDLLDVIVNFNIDSWGGRYNPIIPVTAGEIYPDYWRLLNLSGPDILYCCADVSAATIERLDKEIGAVLIENQRSFEDNVGPRISIDNQASIKATMRKLRDFNPFFLGRPESSILTFNYDLGQPSKVSSFIRRNFGVSWHGFFLARAGLIPAKYPDSPSDRDVLSAIGQGPTLLLPIQLSEHAPPRRVAQDKDSWRDDFIVCLGEGPWNVMHFWNEVYFRTYRGPWNFGIDQLWLPPKILDDQAAYEQLVTVIRRRVHSGQHQRRLRAVSYDHEQPELDKLASKICKDVRSHLIPGKSEQIQKGYFPAIESTKPMQFVIRPPQHEHVRGQKTFLNLQKPEEVSLDGLECWMVDLAIENPSQEAFAANLSPWWKLPRVGAVAGLFTRPTASKVTYDGRLSLQVGTNEQKILLSIPTRGPLFQNLLAPSFWYTLTADLRHSIPHPPQPALRLSDKGKYLQGLLTLFGSLRNAVYFFEHPFWRSTLTELCCPRKSEQVKAKATKTIRKEADKFIREYATDKENAVLWLTETVLQAAEKIPGVEELLQYGSLKESYASYVSKLASKEEQHYASTEDLKETLSQLTRAGVLLQGSEVRCDHCLSQFWYHVDELGKSIACKGCRRDIPLLAEGSWSYRPNALLRKGLREYGLLPVFRLIGRLFEKHNDNFIFLAGAELGNYTDAGFVSAEEIDLTWIRDGEFGIADVKSSTKGFSTDDTDKLVKRAKVARPGTVLLAATEGEDSEIEKWRQKVNQQLEPMGIQVKACGPTFFASPSPYLV